MSKSLIQVNQEDAVLTLRLNRPDRLNSFIEPMARQLQEALAKAQSNDEVRCILITGNGKAFCAGQDLPEDADKGNQYELGDTVRRSYNPISNAIRTLAKQEVCAWHGKERR